VSVETWGTGKYRVSTSEEVHDCDYVGDGVLTPRSRAPLRGTLALLASSPGCALTAFASNPGLVHVLVSDEHSPRADQRGLSIRVERN